MSALSIKALTGAELSARLADVARLRIEVFRAIPYLYDGDLAYEARYPSAFAASANALIVCAFDGDEVVGASTAAPLGSQMEHVRAPLRARGDDLARVFYFGETVLRMPYRGQGIGVRFFELREAHAHASGAATVAFCAVIRPNQHPARPKDYEPLDAFRRRRGFAPEPGLICRLSWREIGEREESPKAMQFWTKRLTP
jgi:hypothetical protein